MVLFARLSKEGGQGIKEDREKNKMQPTNPNAHTYVNGTDVKTHGYAITQNTLSNSLFEPSCTYFPSYQSAVWSVECSVWSVKCRV